LPDNSAPRSFQAGSYFRDAAIVGRADGRKRRCEQRLAHLVGRGEATVEIEDDRFGHWPAALDFEDLTA